MQLSDAFDLGKATTATLKRQKVTLDQVRADTGLRAKITASVLRKAIKDGFLWDGLKVRVQAWGPAVLVELWALAEPDNQKQLSGLFSIVQSESGRAVVNIAPELEISRQRANIILRNLTSPQGQPPLKKRPRSLRWLRDAPQRWERHHATLPGGHARSSQRSAFSVPARRVRTPIGGR